MQALPFLQHLPCPAQVLRLRNDAVHACLRGKFWKRDSRFQAGLPEHLYKCWGNLPGRYSRLHQCGQEFGLVALLANLKWAGFVGKGILFEGKTFFNSSPKALLQTQMRFHSIVRQIVVGTVYIQFRFQLGPIYPDTEKHIWISFFDLDLHPPNLVKQE